MSMPPRCRVLIARVLPEVFSCENCYLVQLDLSAAIAIVGWISTSGFF